MNDICVDYGVIIEVIIKLINKYSIIEFNKILV